MAKVYPEHEVCAALVLAWYIVLTLEYWMCSFRAGQLLNLFWEKTSEDRFYSAITSAALKLNVQIVNYTTTENLHLGRILGQYPDGIQLTGIIVYSQCITVYRYIGYMCDDIYMYTRLIIRYTCKCNCIFLQYDILGYLSVLLY